MFLYIRSFGSHDDECPSVAIVAPETSATMAETTAAATEGTEEPQLAELVNQEAGLSSEIELKVVRNEIIDYSYTWNGSEVVTQKLQVLLQSKIGEQYCLGLARLQRKDKNELKITAQRWETGTTWKFKGIVLHNEKPAYIHTPCRFVIDLRKSKVHRLLPSNAYPVTPVPTVTIADVLQLTQMQRFDLMAIPSKIVKVRTAGTGMQIADVRLVDGSKMAGSTSEEYACLPLTLLFFQKCDRVEFVPILCWPETLAVHVLGRKQQGWRDPGHLRKKSNVVAGSRGPQESRHGRGSSEYV